MIKVVFIDKWGNELFPSVIAEGPVGEFYNSYPITPPNPPEGYKWNQPQSDDVFGLWEGGISVISYVAVPKGMVNVIFIDEWGNELFPSVIAEGPVGDYYSSYPITPPELSGYEWNLANDGTFFDPENDGDAPEPVRYVYMLSTSETSTSETSTSETSTSETSTSETSKNHSDKKGNRKLPQTGEKYSYLIIGVGIIILLSATCYFIFIKGSVAKF